MLSPVKASTSAEFIYAAHNVQDGDGQPVVPLTKAEAALAILKLASDNQAGIKLAGLLGTADISSSDILTKLAIKFAQTLNEQPLPGESAKAFTARLAEIILSMPALERVAAESKSGLMALGISASALAGALKNPTSPAAARLVALIETHLASAKDSALKTAISSYQATAGRDAGVNMRDLSVPANGPQSDPRHPASTGRGVEVLRLLQGGQTVGNAAAALTQAQPGKVAVNLTVGTPNGQNAAEHVAKAASTGAEIAVRNPEQTGRADAQIRQVVSNEIANFFGKENALAAKNGAALAGQAVQLTPAQALSLASSLAADPSLASGRPGNIIDFTREVIARAQNQDEVIAAAQKVAAAVAGRQALLFNAAAPSQDADGDLEKQISRALGNAARASQAAAAGLAAADQAQQQQPAQAHVGVPFAQVPYPQQPVEEARKKARGDGRDGEEREGGEDAGGDEQSMQGDGQGEGGEGGENRERPRNDPYDIPMEDKPFEVDEPLERHASDADRAYHMYQKYGGF